MISNHTIFNIAVASSRKDTNWRNTAITWAELKERCRPVRTAETLKQYQLMTKEQRGEVKDVGGFVGGALKEDGNRKNENLLNRTLLTLDIDSAAALPEKPNPMFAMIIHSTHSHTEEAPRYRMIVPLSRPCSPLEYEALAHRMAEGVGIEMVDMTSCEPVRLMYWASAPKDAPTIYYTQEGGAIDVDIILSTYKDYTDRSEWGTKEKLSGTAGWSQRPNPKRGGALQERPRDKQNIVGAWCRHFDVYHVLNEMLSGLYTPAGSYRYTYAAGSTFAGAVVYDGGDFLYSYHESDPLGGQLLNSWDLYRRAMYGHLDKDSKPQTRNDRLPSYKAMRDYALTIPEVKKDFLAMQINQNVEHDGGDDHMKLPKVDNSDTDWLEELVTTDKGDPVSCLQNYHIILNNDPELFVKAVRYDEFKREKRIVGELPWEREPDDVWTDADNAQLALFIERKYGIKNKNDLIMIADAVVREDRFRYNGVQDFILRAEWDGVQRLDDVFVDYLGAEATDFNRMLTRKSLVACVARAFEPGIKFDQIIVLAGQQGIGKSTLLRKLAGGGRYFMDSFNLDTKSNKMQEAVVGSWIIEIPELEGFYKADMNAIKSFVSKQWDEFRPAYGREKITANRTCVFFATTNDDEFLRDSSGNRRFWIVKCGTPRRDVFSLTEEEVAQIWAEACHLYREGKTALYLDAREERELLELQKTFDIDYDQLGALEAFLDALLPYDWDTFEMNERRDYFIARRNGRTYIRDLELGIPSNGKEIRDEVSAIEVVNEFFLMDNSKGNRQSRIASDLLKKLDGWEMTDKRKTLTGGYGRQKIFRRIKL